MIGGFYLCRLHAQIWSNFAAEFQLVRFNFNFLLTWTRLDFRV